MVKIRQALLVTGGALTGVDAARAEAAAPLAVELDQPTRAKMYLALLAIGLLGLLLLVIIRIGAWSFKRKAKLDRRPSQLGPKNWEARRRLKQPLQRSLGLVTDDEDDEIIEIDDHPERRRDEPQDKLDTPPSHDSE